MPIRLHFSFDSYFLQTNFHIQITVQKEVKKKKKTEAAI